MITDNYAPASSFSYAEDKAAKNIIWVKDVATSEDVVTFTAEEIASALNMGENLAEFAVKSAMLSGDGKYLLIPCDAVMLDNEGKEQAAVGAMPVWDMQNSCWLSLPQEAVDVMPRGISYYRQDGWIMPGTSLINMYGTDGSSSGKRGI